MPSKKHLDENEFRRLYAEDVLLVDIAAKLGCSKSLVERTAKRLGISKQRTGPKNGPRHPKWNNGLTMRKGYLLRYAPDHPNAINGRYVAEHRLVMEQKLGRLLLRKEAVHHLDGNPLNNDIENLMLFQSNGEHLKAELTGRIPNWTPEGYARMCWRRNNRPS